MAALCAAPALAAPALADEMPYEGEGIAGLKQRVEEHWELFGIYFKTYNQICIKEISVEDGAEIINNVATRLARVAEEIEVMAQKASDADIKQYEEIVMSDAFVERAMRTDDHVATTVEDLAGKDYYGSDALRAACQKMMEAFPRG